MADKALRSEIERARKAQHLSLFEPARFAALTATAVVGLSVVGHRFNGPAFIGLYTGIGLAALATLGLAEKRTDSIGSLKFIALLGFEAIGGIRFVDTSLAGGHKFEMLGQLMVVGFLAYLASRFIKKGGGTNALDCSSCSGCGGGCGGCGGCS